MLDCTPNSNLCQLRTPPPHALDPTMRLSTAQAAALQAFHFCAATFANLLIKLHALFCLHRVSTEPRLQKVKFCPHFSAYINARRLALILRPGFSCMVYCQAMHPPFRLLLAQRYNDLQSLFRGSVVFFFSCYQAFEFATSATTL